MKKYITKQNITALGRIAILCALGFLGAGVSPAFAAMLSRGFDVSATLHAVWSMIGPLCVIRYRLRRPDTCAGNNTCAAGRQLAATTILFATIGFLCGLAL